MPLGSSPYEPVTKAQLALPSDFRHQSPTCPSGHPVTNPSLKPSSHFQVTFVTNSSSISRRSGTGLGHTNRGQDSSLTKLARPCSLREPNPTYGSQFRLAVCPLAQGELVTASRRHSERFPHTYGSAALCRTPPPPFGVVGVAPGHSWDTPGTLPVSRPSHNLSGNGRVATSRDTGVTNRDLGASRGSDERLKAGRAR